MRVRAARPAALLAALTLAVAAVACAGESSPTEPTTPTPTEPTTPTPTEPTTPEPEPEPEVPEGPITVYSGRAEELVGHIFADFTEATGIEVDVRYGATAELASTILEEGDASPADVYFAQDPGALGALTVEDRFIVLPDDVTSLVDSTFRSPGGEWVGVSGRVRVFAYSTDRVSEDELPSSIFELTEPEWRGRVSWAPTNGSFQAFVTALRVTEGEDAAREWLEGMIENEPIVFSNNAGQVEAIGRGEVDLALVNHYYLYRFLAEDPQFPAANHYVPGDLGGLMLSTGVGVLASSEKQAAALELVRYMLGEEVQSYFAEVETAPEFPLVAGYDSTRLPTLAELDPPDVDLNSLEDLRGTLELLEELNVFE